MVGKLLLKVSKWKNQEQGSVAVEFSLIVAPLVMIMLGIIELSLFYAAGSILQGGTDAAARVVRTGQVAQAAGDPQELFEDTLCAHAASFIDCNDIVYEVIQVADGFAGASGVAPTYDADGNLVSGGFDPGGSLEVVLIRAAYRYEFVTPLVGPLLSDGYGMSRLLMSTVVIETEPYNHNF